MMKSVALTESAVQRIDSRSTSAGGDTTECDAEDFILVSSSPNAESATWEVSFDDDASYDRCDDVCSIFSAPQSLAIESNALDSFQKDFFSRGGADASSNKSATEDFLLHDLSAMGLSSGGIIDLPDDDLRELIASFSVDDDDDSIDGQLPPPFETSDSSVSGASNVHDSDDDDEAIAKLHPVAWGKAPVVTTQTGSPPDHDNNPASSDDGRDDDDDLASILDEAMSRKVSIKPTRLCKKKRRKQLKLAKKAAAAAAAAAALTHFGGMVGTTPASARGGAAGGKHPNGGKLNKRNASRSRKQIANIAVACATESYASYREECLRKSKK